MTDKGREGEIDRDGDKDRKGKERRARQEYEDTRTPSLSMRTLYEDTTVLLNIDSFNPQEAMLSYIELVIYRWESHTIQNKLQRVTQTFLSKFQIRFYYCLMIPYLLTWEKQITTNDTKLLICSC